MKIKTLFIFLLISLSFQLNYLHPVGAETGQQFKDVFIEEPYKSLLASDPDFMQQGGAKMVQADPGSQVLVGIGRVFLQDSPGESMDRLLRRGEMRARAEVLELKGEFEITSYRANSVEQSFFARTSLSVFLQVTESRIEDEVRQLPAVGTWWAADGRILYVAVGKATAIDATSEVLPAGKDGIELHNFEGEEPYVSLIKGSPLLHKIGGVHGFVLEDGKKVILAVNSSAIGNSWIKARRIAQLKAIRIVLENKASINISSVEYLRDQEKVLINENTEKVVAVSEFLEVTEEQVAGQVKSMPIVAIWSDIKEKNLYVAIGK